MPWHRVFLIVTGCGFIGMMMGGLFGLAAGALAPDLFRHAVPWQVIAPIGFAVVLGATAGVLLGGGLGCFAVVVQLLVELRSPSSQNQSRTKTAADDERQR